MTEPTQNDPAAQEKLLSTETNVTIQPKVEIRSSTPPPTATDAAAASASATDASTKAPVKDKKAGIAGVAALVCCGSVTTLAFLAILAAVPITQIVVGWHYADQCPINWRIPHYSFIAGVLGLVTIVLLMLQAILGIIMAAKFNDENFKAGFVAATCSLCGISVVVLFIVIFLFGWFIAGCVWVFGAWDRVQYNDPDGANYCHPTVYRVTFWLLILSIIYQVYSCCRSSSQANAQKKNAKQAKAATAKSTTEKTPVAATEP